MSAAAKARVEAMRYRLQVRLGLVLDAARREHDQQRHDEARTLRRALDGFTITEADAANGRAEELLAGLEPGVRMLEDHFELGGERELPRWLRYAAITAPVALVVLALVWLIERRRRLKQNEVDEAMLARLDALGEKVARQNRTTEKQRVTSRRSDPPRGTSVPRGQ